MMRFTRFLRTLAISKPTPRVNEAQQALNEVNKLWRAGELKAALQKIDEIERTHPSCSKAAKYYKGEIGVELLEKNGDLPLRKP